VYHRFLFLGKSHAWRFLFLSLIALPFAHGVSPHFLRFLLPPLPPLHSSTNYTALGKVTSYGKPALGGPWTLVDFTGKPVTDADFRGEFLLLYFGFTHCPDICPSELVKVGRILDLLDKEQSLPMVRPVFISVDPDRDNVGQLRHYAQGALSWMVKKQQGEGTGYGRGKRRDVE
jgi:cytochrome oxidase Cu insertion factor (SCO1/SenC/PrrC family)